MGYVAVKGGNEAIERACQLFAHERTKGTSPPLGVDQIKEQLYLAVDRVMGEGSLYAPDLAALALKQSAGDTFEASFMLRAFRATQQRLGYSLPASTEKMRVVRRISSAFKDIPGGQILGATSDYTLRLLDFDLLKDDAARRRAFRERIFSSLPADAEIPDTFPKVIRILRREGLLEETLVSSASRGGGIRHHPSAAHISGFPQRQACRPWRGERPAGCWPWPIPACAAMATSIRPWGNFASATCRSRCRIR